MRKGQGTRVNIDEIYGLDDCGLLYLSLLLHLLFPSDHHLLHDVLQFLCLLLFVGEYGLQVELDESLLIYLPVPANPQTDLIYQLVILLFGVFVDLFSFDNDGPESILLVRVCYLVHVLLELFDGFGGENVEVAK